MRLIIKELRNRVHFFGFSDYFPILTTNRLSQTFVDFLNDLIFSVVNKNNDLLLLLLIKQIIDDLGGSCVPVQDYGVICRDDPSFARVNIFDNAGNKVGDKTDQSTCEGQCSDKYYDDTRNRKRAISQIGIDKIFNAAGVKDHGKSSEDSVKKAEFIISRKFHQQ